MVARNKNTALEMSAVRMLDVDSLCAYLNPGRNRAVEFSRCAGAERRIGRRCLYDKSERFTKPFRSAESLAEYTAKKKDEQTDLKDTGCYIFAAFKNGGSRKGSNIEGLDAVVLGYDGLTPRQFQQLREKLLLWGEDWHDYKHRPKAPGEERRGFPL